MASTLGRLLIQSCSSTPDSSLFLYPLALSTSIHAGLPVIKPPLVYKRHWRVTEEKQQPLSWNPVAVTLWIPINTGCILKQYITIEQINCSQHQKLIWNHIRKSEKRKKNLSQRGKYILSQKQKLQMETTEKYNYNSFNMLQKFLFLSFDLFFWCVIAPTALQQIKNTVWI